MVKQLKLDFYSNGYNEREYNCYDIPFAIACGYYNYDNYFYYLFNNAANTNWARKDGQPENREVDMKTLGLGIKYYKINDSNSLINIIKSEIDNNHPLLLPVMYKYIFYGGSYKQSYNGHLYLINGYNPETGIIQIRESLNVLSSDLINNNIGLYPFNIREDYLLEMWEGSKSEYGEKENLYDYIYSIEKVCEPEISSYNQLIDNFLSSHEMEGSIFLDCICNHDYNLDSTQSYNKVKLIRKQFLYYIDVFFDLIYRYISTLDIEPDLINEFIKFKDEYRNYRSLCITKFQIHLLSDIDYEFDEVCEKTVELDKEFFNLLSRIRINIKKAEFLNSTVENNASTDYAANGVITTDTCCESDKNRYIPGNVIKDDNSLWRSSTIDFIHWIMVELDKPKTINKVCIKFDKNPKKIIKDFSIQGSNCGNTWTDLAVITGNSKETASYDIGPSRYKYFRLYITHTGIYDAAARVRKLEMWGEPGQD